MYCQWRFFTFLYAALGLSCNRRHDSSLSSLERTGSNNSEIALDRVKSALNASDKIALSDTRDLVGIGTESPLDCSLKLDAAEWDDHHTDRSKPGAETKTMLEVKLTLSSSDRSVEGLHRCKGRVTKLLRNQKEILLYQSAVVDPLLFPHELVPLHNGSTNRQENLRRTSLRPASCNNGPRSEGLLGKTRVAPNDHNLNVNGDICNACTHGKGDDGTLAKDYYHGRLRNLRIWAITAIVAVLAVAARYLFISFVVAKSCERIRDSMQWGRLTGRPVSRNGFPCTSRLYDEDAGLFPGNLFKEKDLTRLNSHDIATDDADQAMASTRNKFTRFGHLTNAPRKRIQDLFDLEPLKTQNRKNAVERVPVLPRAPNASMRRRLRKFYYPGVVHDAHYGGYSQGVIRSRSRTVYTANSSQRCNVSFDDEPGCELNNAQQ